MGSRRRGRISGEVREAIILAAAEQLLAEGAFLAATVDDLAKAASISRPTFYFYFSSKSAVLLALLDRRVRELSAQVAAIVARPVTDPWDTWHATISSFLDSVREHEALVGAVFDARENSPEVRSAWDAVMSIWINGALHMIEQERNRGAAPVGADAHSMAMTLCLMNERLVQAALADGHGETAWIDMTNTLTHIWVASIYQPTRPRP